MANFLIWEQGFSRIIIYNYGNHPNVDKVLAAYEATGFVELLPFTLAAEQPTDLLWLHMYFVRGRHFNMYQHFEHIVRHDCLYRYRAYSQMLPA